MKASKQTKIKLRKGFHNAPLVYKVLAVGRLPEQDLKLVTKTLVKINTPKQAEKLVSPGTKWGLYKTPYDPRLAICLYRGVEVAVFWKRATVDVVPDPVDPVPEDALEHEEDVWIRFDLFGKSARQQLKIIRAETESQEHEANLLKVELESNRRILNSQESQIKALQTKLKTIQKKESVIYYGDLDKKDRDRLQHYYDTLLQTKTAKKGK